MSRAQDRAVDGTPTDSGDDTVPCSGANCRYKLNLTDAKSKAYAAGHVTVLTDLQKALGEGPLVANHGFGKYRPHPTTCPAPNPRWSFVSLCWACRNGSLCRQARRTIISRRGRSLSA